MRSSRHSKKAYGYATSLSPWATRDHLHRDKRDRSETFMPTHRSFDPAKFTTTKTELCFLHLQISSSSHRKLCGLEPVS
jgi:hypothetical protein